MNASEKSSVLVKKTRLSNLIKVRLSVQWIAVLVLIPTSADKTFVKDIEAICKLYRSCSTAVRGDPMFHQPESSLPFIIDLLTQTFSLEGDDLRF